MIFIKNQSRNFSEISAKGQRLIYVDTGTTGENEGEEINTNFKAYDGDIKAYKENIKKAVDQRQIDKDIASQLLQSAQFKNIETSLPKNEQYKKKELLKKIKERRDKERKKKTIAKSAVDSIEKGYTDSVESLRAFVRNKIESIGVEFSETENKEVLEAALDLEKEIWESIEGLLKPEHKDIISGVEEDKKRAERCYEKLRGFFEEKDDEFNPKLNLLDFLKTKVAIPAKVKVEINSLFVYAERVGDDWDKNHTLVNVVKPDELIDLELALDSVNMLYEKWKTEVPEQRMRLERKLDEYQSGLSKFKSNFERRKDIEHIKEGIVGKFNCSWEDIYSRKIKDLEHLQKLLSENDDEPTRRLITAFLNGNMEELQQWENFLKEQSEEEAKTEVAKKEHDHDEHGHDDHDEHGHGHAHGNVHVQKIAKKLHKFFTANGKITWYSMHDIAGSFELIKESWEKHIHSISEDKRGPLAEGVMFWKPEVERRIAEQDRIAEKGRAEDRKKHYKNSDYEQLIAELEDRPAKDKRRAILEILAEKGNLRMSDRRLIVAVCNKGTFSKIDWDKADAGAEYSAMRNAFKKSIDNNFIGETGYSEELLNKQASGSDTSAEAGKRLAGSGEAVSISAEINLFNVQRSKSYKLGTEGEYQMGGMVETMVGRANAFSNTKAFVDIEIGMEDGEKEKLKKANTDMGLVGLMLTDSYLKGAVSREFLAGIGKKHESGFNPFSSWSDVLALKNENIGNRYVSKFEKWGWIVEKEDGKGGYITELGKTQIINFFNTRNAKAAILDENGKETGKTKLVHIAIDSSTYQRHSRRHQSVRDVCGQKITLGDKLVSYAVKKSNLDVFSNATEKATGGTGAVVGETDQIASLIKAGVEDFVDGMEMMKKDERYYDSSTQNEISEANGWTHSNDGWRKIDETGKEIFISEEHVISYGKERMERGRDILVRMLENLYLYTEDRSILNKNGQFSTVKRDATGIATDSNGDQNLRTFFTDTLGKYYEYGEYQDVMNAFERLENRNVMRKRKDIENKKIDREEALVEADQAIKQTRAA